ncbi:hypothetical protein RB195_022187 [Necator americanus]|uniref:Uncharacterized protein n=1 Tax=Necator americanus TaxID=51031 RepID=A0ABR1EEA7_NECAM
MMQTKKIKYDIIGLTETRRRHLLNAVYETGEEVFLGTCDSRGVGVVEVLPRRSCLLQGHNWRFQRQSWPKKNAGGTSHRDPRPTMERPGGGALYE